MQIQPKISIIVPVYKVEPYLGTWPRVCFVTDISESRNYFS